MSDNNPAIITLHHLLNYNAGKFTNAEVQLKNSLSKWTHDVESLKFKMVLQKYADIVDHHIQKMEQYFEEENINSLSLENKVMQAFIEETNDKLSLCTDAEVKDACLLAGIQAINHFKISTYGTAAAFANALGMEKQAMLFYEAEVSEKQIDDRLSQLAMFEVNNRAKSPISLPG